MKNVIVIMPAYNAEKTLARTCEDMPKVYDEIVVCDDASSDGTHEESLRLGLTTIRHERNKGYGANQKTLYDYAVSRGASIVIMVHPDNQYTTACLPDMISKIEKGASLVIGTRMQTARKNRMPLWKYASNRLLTTLQNITFGTSLSEFHSGLRAYDTKALRMLPYHGFSDDFVFDSEMIASMRAYGFSIQEVPTECFYNDSVSSINFQRSLSYGMSTLKTLLLYGFGYYGPN
jgi:glycosyltransferase involved in cell wall biosynthesis